MNENKNINKEPRLKKLLICGAVIVLLAVLLDWLIIRAANSPIFLNPEQEILPKAGQLWWPVPVMLICGVVLVIIGVYLRKHDG